MRAFGKNTIIVAICTFILTGMSSLPMHAQELKEDALKIEDVAIGTYQANIYHSTRDDNKLSEGELELSLYVEVSPESEDHYLKEPFSVEVLYPDGSKAGQNTPIVESDVQFYQRTLSLDKEPQAGEYTIRAAAGVEGEDYGIMGETTVNLPEDELSSKFEPVKGDEMSYSYENGVLEVEWEDIDEAKSYQVFVSSGKGSSMHRQRDNAFTTDNRVAIEGPKEYVKTIQVHAYTIPAYAENENSQIKPLFDLQGEQVLHRSRIQYNVN